MDLSTIVPSARVIEITHPATGMPLGLTITLRPETDPAAKASERKILDTRLHDRTKMTTEKLEAQRLETVVGRISGWNWAGDLTFHGEKPEATSDNYRKVLTELDWILPQIETELGDRAGFFRAPSVAAG